MYRQIVDLLFTTLLCVELMASVYKTVALVKLFGFFWHKLPTEAYSMVECSP